MSDWLSVQAGFIPRDVDVDVARYNRTADALIQVEDAVGRAVAGAAWLQRFPAGGSVRIELVVSAGDRVAVRTPRKKSYGGPKSLVCRADIPAGWYEEPGDGLLVIRFLRAVLQALNAIGTHYGLGPPPIRPARADTGKPALIDLFAPRPVRPPIFREAADSIDRLVDTMSPAELLLGAVEPAGRGIDRKRLAVARSLGVVESEQVFGAGQEQQVRVWTIRRTT